MERGPNHHGKGETGPRSLFGRRSPCSRARWGYTFEHDKPRFHRAPAPSPTELRQLLDTLIARITRTLVRGGVLIEEPEHPYLDLELNSPLHQLSAAAVRYPFAVGPLAGRKTMTLRNPHAVGGQDA